MTPQLDSSELLTNSQCSLSELRGVCTSLAPLLSRSSLLILTINNVNSHKQMSALTFHNNMHYRYSPPCSAILGIDATCICASSLSHGVRPLVLSTAEV